MTKKAKNHIWKNNEKTSTEEGITKDAKLNGQKITSINATAQLEQATNEFGPYGFGFGLEEIKYTFIEVGEGQKMAHAECVFFYTFNEVKCSFPISSAGFLTKKTKNGLYADKDFAKKIETDITTKALSKLGFNADIFKGKWDDNAYIQEIEKEEEVKATHEKQIYEMLDSKYASEKKKFTELLMKSTPPERGKWITLFNSCNANEEHIELMDKFEQCETRQEREAAYSLLIENKDIKV